MCAADDPRYARITAQRRRGLGVRSPALGNTRPTGGRWPTRTRLFMDDWAFAHNGAIHPQDRLDEILPAGWRSQMRGTTDSERYFLAIVARMRTAPRSGTPWQQWSSDIFDGLRAHQPQRDAAGAGRPAHHRRARSSQGSNGGSVIERRR